MSNPIFNEKSLEKVIPISNNGEAMSLKGAVNKSLQLLAITIITAAVVWWKFGGDLATLYNPLPWLIGSGVAGFILVIAATFKKQWSPVIAPLYAVAEGVFVSIISMLYSGMFPGIVGQAVVLTLLVLGVMLLSYKMGWLKASAKFKKVIVYATLGIAAFYIIILISSLLGFKAISNFYAGSSPLSIGISVVVCAIAALNLILDFDMMEQGEKMQLPRYMEWFSALSLLVTLVWLYLEILRLLSKLRD